MSSIDLVIFGFFVVMMTIGGTAFYFSSDAVQRKYNPNNE